MGTHAVAVTGYNLGKKAPVAQLPTGFLLKASRINKIYAHDDGIGPYARMELQGETKTVTKDDNETFDRPYLTTSWRGDRPCTERVRAEPLLLLIPLYHKIRISFQQIQYRVVSFDDFIEQRNIRELAGLRKRFVWDIYLDTVGNLKKELFENRVEGLEPTLRGTSLLKNFPKYVWRAVAEYNSTPVLELIFDATDISQGSVFFHAIEYDARLSVVPRTQIKDPTVSEDFPGQPVWGILKWFGAKRKN